jgi:chromosome segregation ATPase
MNEVTQHILQNVIEALIGVVIAGCGWYLYKLGSRVDMIEVDLRKYESDVGVGVKDLSSLTKMIQAHMDREEDKLGTLELLYRDLLVKLTTLVTKLDNVASAASNEYARIASNEKEAEDWKQRVVRIETRIEQLETKRASL